MATRRGPTRMAWCINLIIIIIIVQTMSKPLESMWRTINSSTARLTLHFHISEGVRWRIRNEEGGVTVPTWRSWAQVRCGMELPITLRGNRWSAGITGCRLRTRGEQYLKHTALRSRRTLTVGLGQRLRISSPLFAGGSRT